MNFYSNKSFPPAKIGDTARVQIPEVDRSRVDPTNVLLIVVSIRDDKYYTLA